MDQSQVVTGKLVAVIGAGVSGLVAAKRLAAEGFQVHVFDRRRQAGGLWNYSPDPNTRFASPVYADLQTNFPRQLMELQDYPWTTQPLFMQHKLVQQYLEEYAQDIKEKCKSRVQFYFDFEVVRLFHESYAGGHWSLTWKSVSEGTSGTYNYLYVIVAVGVYDEPWIPYYEGLSGWKEMWGNSISHAKTYRNPDAFRGKNVLVVGYQASGFDIANKISTSVSKLWISSTRPIEGGLPAKAVLMAGVSRFDSAQGFVTFTDEQTIFDVDHIIFCTGYQYHQPFIKKNGNTDEPLFPSGPTIEHLHEHIIYIEQPTLAFLGIVKDAVPTFLVVQAQAAFVSRFFSDQLRSLHQRTEDPHHRLPYPMFMDYLMRLESLCDQADNSQEWNVSRYTNPVFRWTLELDQVRTRRREIRNQFLTLSRAVTAPGGVWSTAGMIHYLHWKCIQLRSNMQDLFPFLVLFYGYKGDHGHNSTLPFQGWNRGIGNEFITAFEESRALYAQLGPDSKDVIKLGTQTLSLLVKDRWEAFCHKLPNGRPRSREELLLQYFTILVEKGMPANQEMSCDDDEFSDDRGSGDEEMFDDEEIASDDMGEFPGGLESGFDFIN